MKKSIMLGILFVAAAHGAENNAMSKSAQAELQTVMLALEVCMHAKKDIRHNLGRSVPLHFSSSDSNAYGEWAVPSEEFGASCEASARRYTELTLNAYKE